MKSSSTKIIPDIENLSSKLDKLPGPYVFTNGCFDFLHRGHIDYLEKAAQLGRHLIVGVNSDESVKRLGKGENRPVNSLEDRMAVLAALECVSAVIAFEEDTPLKLIQAIRPEHLVKGGDWEKEDIVGGDFVESIGGTVHSIPFQYDRSTSNLIEKIKQS